MSNPEGFSTAQVYSAEWPEMPRGALQSIWPTRVLGPRVVELGAATGRNAALLPLDWSYIGYERNEALARTGQLLNRDIRQSDLTDPSSDLLHHASGANTVLMLDVLEHLPSPEALLASLASSARPGSRWLISIPNFAFLPTRLRVAFGSFPKSESGHFDATHLHHFTKATLGGWLLKDIPAKISIVGTAYPILGNRLRRRTSTRWVIPTLRTTSALATERFPTLFAYEWLCTIDFD